jgi:drug/metabolite transporter (DMT)-like permease
MTESSAAMSESSPVARLQVLATAILFSTGGAVIKATTLSGWQVASFRSGLAAVAIFLMLPSARRRWSWRVVAVGGAYAAALISYVLANKMTTAANTIFLYSTAPLYILVLGPMWLKERPRRRDLVLMAALAVGLGLVLLEVEPAASTAPRPVAGNLVAATGGFFWALVVMGLRWLGRRQFPIRGGSTAAVVAGNVIACLVCLPAALPVAGSTAQDWWLVAYLGLIQVGLAYFLLTAALRRVPAFEVSLLLLIEPMLNPLWAWWLHAEVPGRWSIAGGALILLATLASILPGFAGAQISRPTGQ